MRQGGLVKWLVKGSAGGSSGQGQSVKGTGSGGAVRSAEKAGQAPDGAGCDWLESVRGPSPGTHS